MLKTCISSILLLFCLCVQAQDITGVWRGTFVSGLGESKQRYKYEVQIENKPNNALGGVTYSYRTTIFYGKSSLQGIFMKKDKSVIIKENRLLDVKILDGSDACLMTCYLDYSKNGNVEVLEGTFSSVNIKDQSECGSGSVYLERVEESEFKKEDFVIKYEQRKKAEAAKLAAKKAVAKTALPKKTVASKPVATVKPKPKTPVPVAKKPVVKPRQPVVAKAPASGSKKVTQPVIAPSTAGVNRESIKVEPLAPPEPLIVPEVKQDIPVKKVETPGVLKNRENSLVRKLVTRSADIRIELYDNGEIDNDTISVYHNHTIIVNKKRLNHEPIVINLTAAASQPVHEFVMVAENMGLIPPNTALMVITTGGKRYELYLVSTEEKNAKVVIEYQP